MRSGLAGLSAAQLSWAVFALALATIGAAWGFELAGYAPCELCLAQRTPYYIGVPVAAFVALLVGRAPHWLARSGLALVLLIFAGSAVFGVYHAGVEWQFWPGPTACTGVMKPAATIDGFLTNLKATHVVRCDAVAIRILGLSLAGWNALVSAVLTVLAALAIRRTMP